MSNLITHEHLNSVLSYDGESGLFTWKVANRNVSIGDAAGRKDKDGYRIIRINRRDYRAHRLAWFYVHGRWPEHQIDHKNGDPTDNRIANLREATNSQNGFNKPAMRNNKTGMKGVAPGRNGKFRAQIAVAGKIHHLGHFDTAEAAAKAYAAAALRLHGEFARPI